MKATLYHMLYDAEDACMIDGQGLQPPAELAERNRAKTCSAIARLGPKWCLFNERAALNVEAELSAQSHEGE